MNAFDVEITRNIRRELGKRAIDPTRMDIQVVNGHVTFAGTVAPLRSVPNVDLQYEMDQLMRILTKEPLIKDIQNGVKFIFPEDRKEDHSKARGRMRY